MPRILLIEDDCSLRRALCLSLEKIGYTVFEANDGREGLKAYTAQPVDLVITDMIMPEMEGVETIRALRKLNPTLKIIAITGGGRGTADGYLHLAAQFGAAKVFTKPFELAELCAAAAQLLGTAEKAGELPPT